MDLTLGPAHLKTPFTFSIFNQIGKFSTVAGRIGHVSRIGVCLSGGPDSLAVLSLVLTELQEKGKLGSIPVTCFTVIKNDGCTYYADRLLRAVERKYKCKIEHVTNIDNPLANVFPSAFDSDVMTGITRSYQNMILYVGINLPPGDDIVTFQNSSEAALDPTFAATNKIEAPLLHLHKPQILDLIYQLGNSDLIPYTHSCVMQPVGQCNTCFSCEERAWGFRALNKEDPGTIIPDIDDITFAGEHKTPQTPEEQVCTF